MITKILGINMATLFLFIFYVKTELSGAGFFPIKHQLPVGLLLEVFALGVLEVLSVPEVLF